MKTLKLCHKIEICNCKNCFPFKSLKVYITDLHSIIIVIVTCCAGARAF